MTARIFRPSKSAMQSGLGRCKDWVLEHEGTGERFIDPLMGWTGSSDTQAQVRLEFDTKEEAIAYAEARGLPYRVVEPQERKAVRKSYADNFRYGRIGSWTH